MRVAIIGQQDFGKSVLEAFLARGDEVPASFVPLKKRVQNPTHSRSWRKKRL